MSFVDFHKKHGGQHRIKYLHLYDHPYDSGLIVTEQGNSVAAWVTKEEMRPQYYQNRVNAGIHILSLELLRQEFESERVDLDRQMLKPLAGTGKMYAYDSFEYVKDMGTPDRYKKVCEDFRKKLVKAKNRKNPQKAIFLDRDGTINEHVGFLKDINQFALLPGVAEAVKKINDSGYLAIVVSNQPVIARGDITEDELRKIHDKMETLLGEKGAYIDGIYYCPHHPDKGFAGEVPELKKVCSCRKPEPGMLLTATEDYHIDLSESWMIGDSEIDIMAGKSAGCRTILLSEADRLFGQDLTEVDLYDAVDRIITG